MQYRRRLTRSRRYKVIAGVCAGLAQYFGWEIDKTRLVYILISVFSAAFPGLLIYLILWFVMPEE
ncbi:PspC domain-containing protein [Fulvivirga sp. RKSG066]|uniref:PspC domain-containing protein n=1 Tax=Fulvivirga aurantia TaxID=2529383 RepID=UPI0012BC968A|nr:PspC domain-containing protein [Fulvivirga aurantia]MTI21667.1 PspC domain-containing protein [Fulvivirga aurantia]